MSHEALRLTDSLFSKPLLMTEESCKEVARYLDKRNTSSIKDLTELASSELDSLTQSNKRDITAEGVGMINIHGPISTYSMPLESFCNVTSMESIVSQANEFASDDSIKVIALNVRSGGGLAHKAFEYSEELKSIAENSGKKLVCYIDEKACSAAYIFASVAEKVMINPTAKSGSIGVLIELQSNTKKLEKEGIERKFVTSSDGKIPYAEDGTFRDEFIKDLQDDVDSLYKDFVSHVSHFRGMDEQTIIDTNAKVFSANKSKKLGLVDEVMTTKKFKEYLSELVNTTSIQNPVKSNVASATNLKTKEENTLMSDNTPDITPEMLAQLQEQLAAQTAQLEAYQAKEALAAKASLEEKLSGIDFLADSKDSLVSFFLSADEANVSLMNNVIESAQASQAKLSADLEEKLSSAQTDFNAKLAEANSKVEGVEKEMLEVKKEFGMQTAIEGSPKDKTVNVDATSGAARTAQLEAFVKAQTANK